MHRPYVHSLLTYEDGQMLDCVVICAFHISLYQVDARLEVFGLTLGFPQNLLNY